MNVQMPRCPKCHQSLRQPIPDAPAKARPADPIKQYAIERMYGVKRMDGGFV